MLGYLCVTRFLFLIKSIDKNREVCAHVNGAYAARADSKDYLVLNIAKRDAINLSKQLRLIATKLIEIKVVTNRE